MRPLPLAAALSLTLAALTAGAEDLPPPNLAPLPHDGPAPEGATARLLAAHQLQAMGMAQKDPVLLLAAAHLMAGVTLREVTRATADPVAAPVAEPKPAEKGKKKKAKADPVAETPPPEAAPQLVPQVVPDPATAAPLPGTLAIPQLLDAARDMLPEGDILRDVIADARSDTPPPGPVAEVTALQQGAGGATTFALPMAGQSYGEIGLLRLSGGAATLRVTDALGNPVCEDKSASPSALCGFVPRQSDRFLVTIRNDGAAPVDYLLITN